jgi:hypothetical protein
MGHRATGASLPLDCLLLQRIDARVQRADMLGNGLQRAGDRIGQVAPRRAIGQELARLLPPAEIALAGMPTTTTPAGTSWTTTALAPTLAPAPTVIGPSTWAPEPTMAPLPMVGWRLWSTWAAEFREGATPPRVTPW